MFDNHNDDQQPADQFGAASSPLMPDTPVSGPAAADDNTNGAPAPDSTFSAPTIVAPSDSSSLPAPSDTPMVHDDAPMSEPSTSPLPSVGSVSSPAEPTSSHDDLLTPGAGDDLLKLKQNALQELSPLVGHLEQTPEEKFRTTMMMIQATDDKTLLQSAYEAAQKISDEKVRAQALLDVVNEINYFTQHQA